MRKERGGALLALGVLIVSAVLGGIYGPAVRATATSADQLKKPGQKAASAPMWMPMRPNPLIRL